MNHYISILFFYILSIYLINSPASEKQIKSKDTLESIGNQPTLFFAEEIQKKSGLKTLLLKKVKLRLEKTVYGKAINAEPLLRLSNQYLGANATQIKAKLRLTQAIGQLSHLNKLHKGQSVSTRKLKKQQALIQYQQAAYDESIRQLNVIVKKTKLQWGDQLTQWVTGKFPIQFDKLINGKSTLLKTIIPVNYSVYENDNSIFISPTGNRNLAFTASFVCVLPQVDDASQGLQFLYQTDNIKVKAGMNFTAWVPNNQNYQTGIVIPESSVVWHLGQSFVFVKVQGEHFIHRNITPLVLVNNGYFVGTQLAENEEIVISGVQMLLSHELKSQIPDEDD